jgi:hypothetical protein
MAFTKQRVPTVEEMRAKLEGNAVIPTSADLATAVDAKAEAILREVDRKLAQAQDRRVSPAARREAIIDVLTEEGIDPVRELAILAKPGAEYNGAPVPLDTRVRILMELTQYVAPKLKTVEVRGEVEHTHTLVIERYGDDGTIQREKLPAPKGSPAVEVPMIVKTAIEGEVQDA